MATKSIAEQATKPAGFHGTAMQSDSRTLRLRALLSACIALIKRDELEGGSDEVFRGLLLLERAFHEVSESFRDAFEIDALNALICGSMSLLKNSEEAKAPESSQTMLFCLDMLAAALEQVSLLRATYATH